MQYKQDVNLTYDPSMIKVCLTKKLIWEHKSQVMLEIQFSDALSASIFLISVACALTTH